MIKSAILGNTFIAISNIKQDDYEKLKSSIRGTATPIEELVGYIEKRFGFPASKIQLVYSAPLKHVSEAKSTVCDTGLAIKREPFFFLSEKFNFIRFTVEKAEYEVVDGKLYTVFLED